LARSGVHCAARTLTFNRSPHTSMPFVREVAMHRVRSIIQRIGFTSLSNQELPECEVAESTVCQYIREKKRE